MNKNKILDFIEYIGLAAVLITVWQIASDRGLINPLTLPSPAAILKRFVALIQNGSLPKNLLISTRRVLTGYVISAVLAVVLGIMIGLSRHFKRMTDLIPPESAKRFREEVIPPGAEKVLTDELIETIRVFFGNDLNLSTTARQLFIHRNTLLYRMDKIRKATGLDLRRFEDAAVFRIMMDIPGEGINE